MHSSHSVVTLKNKISAAACNCQIGKICIGNDHYRQKKLRNNFFNSWWLKYCRKTFSVRNFIFFCLTRRLGVEGQYVEFVKKLSFLANHHLGSIIVFYCLSPFIKFSPNNLFFWNQFHRNKLIQTGEMILTRTGPSQQFCWCFYLTLQDGYCFYWN